MKVFAIIVFIVLSTACSATPFEPTLLAAPAAVAAVTPDPTPASPVAPVVEAPAPTPAPTPAPKPAPKPEPVPTTPVAAQVVNCQVSAWVLSSVSAWSECKKWRPEEPVTQHFRSENYTRTITVQPSGGGAACPALTMTQIPYYDCTP